jgi:hypothetical protein
MESGSLPPRILRPAKNNGSRIVAGHAGDHALVHALLRAVNQSPSHEDFVTWLDEPSYEPSDRLLFKHGDRILAHLHLLHRTAWFDGLKLPVGGAQDLAVLPEYAHNGYEQELIAAAERSLRASGAVVSLVRTERPEPFRACGWLDVRGQGFSEVSISDILAQLTARAPSRPRRARGLRIRRWRHFELDAVRAVYSAAAACWWGPIYRPEQYWRWLVGRKAHSELIVAVDGADEWQDVESHPHIVGYAVTSRARIVELCCLPEYVRAAPRLLVRACQDAIERDHHMLSLHAPAGDPLHEIIVTAGGSWRSEDRTGGTMMVKLLDSAGWVEAIYPILRRRAKGAGLPRPLALAFDVGHDQYRLVLTRRSSRLVADEVAKVDIRCDPGTFCAMLVGNLNVTAACGAGRLEAADDDTLHRLAVLFPPALFWQSQFDALRF